MQVNQSQAQMLQQIRGTLSDRKITAQEMKSLNETLAQSTLLERDKQAIGQLVAKLGEISQSKGEQFLLDSELEMLHSMADKLESPMAERFTETLTSENEAQIAEYSGSNGTVANEETEESAPKRNFFQMILDAIVKFLKWLASLFGFGGDKNEAKSQAVGSAQTQVSFDQEQFANGYNAPPPDLSGVEATRDYSNEQFSKVSNYLNNYARPAAPVDQSAFEQYMAVPSSLRPEEAAPDPAQTQPDPADPNKPVTPPTPDKPADAPAGVDAPAKPNPQPTGRMYQRSPHHDPAKFIPQFPMAAFHESGVYRRDWDPYAVGAISKPKKSDDLGGKTYGTYQFESSMYLDGSSRGNRGGRGSTLDRFINDPANPFGPHLKAAAQTHGLASRAFDALWTKFAREHNLAFGQAQEAFVLKDKGNSVQNFMKLAKLSPEVSRDPRIIDLVMGTLNHVDSLANGAAIHLARLQERAGRSFSANEIGKALTEYKETKITSWFISSPGAHRGIENRFEAENRVFS